MTHWVSSYSRVIVFVLAALVEVTIGQDTLFGLPPIPGDELPTTTTKPPSTLRVYRFGPFLPFVQHAALPHPTLPPFLIHPFDTYNNINPIPELPPQPETKYNGFYDLDGNFVPYGSDRARGYGVGKQRPKRELSPDSKDEALHQKLMEEEYAYDDENREHKSTTIAPTTEAIQTTATQKEVVTERTTVAPTTIKEESKTTIATTTAKEEPTEIKPTQLPTRPLFVSGNSRSRSHVSDVVQSESIPPQNKPKTVDSQVTFNKPSTLIGNQTPKGPYQVNKKPTQISSQQFAKGLVLPRQHQKPTQNRPPPSLQANFINAHKRPKANLRTTTQRPKLPARKISNRRPNKQRLRQFDPAPLKVAQHRPPVQQQVPQFVPLQARPQIQQRAWAAPSVADNRDPTVIAYLRDLEDYDWNYNGVRPNLEGPALAFQQQNGVTTPETLVPLNSGFKQQALVGTTPAPYIPQQVVTPSYTAPPPQPQQPAFSVAPGKLNELLKTIPSNVAPAINSLSKVAPGSDQKAYTPAPSADFLGWFGGTPHPLLDVRRLFGGTGAGLFGR